VIIAIRRYSLFFSLAILSASLRRYLILRIERVSGREMRSYGSSS
jgi:hypothetical protein